MLQQIESGDFQAASRLLPLVYDELRRLAAWHMANEKPGQTLQATALVHEAYLRLVGKEDPQWNGRRHFFGAAAEAMRRILVENARRKKRLKHGGHLERVDADDVDLPAPMPDDELLAMDEALDRLANGGFPGGGSCETLFLCRPDAGAGCETTGGFHRHRRTDMVLCAGLAVPGNPKATQSAGLNSKV